MWLVWFSRKACGAEMSFPSLTNQTHQSSGEHTGRRARRTNRKPYPTARFAYYTRLIAQIGGGWSKAKSQQIHFFLWLRYTLLSNILQHGRYFPLKIFPSYFDKKKINQPLHFFISHCALAISKYNLLETRSETKLLFIIIIIIIIDLSLFR